MNMYRMQGWGSEVTGVCRVWRYEHVPYSGRLERGRCVTSPSAGRVGNERSLEDLSPAPSNGAEANASQQVSGWVLAAYFAECYQAVSLTCASCLTLLPP